MVRVEPPLGVGGVGQRSIDSLHFSMASIDSLHFIDNWDFPFDNCYSNDKKRRRREKRC